MLATWLLLTYLLVFHKHVTCHAMMSFQLINCSVGLLHSAIE